MKQGKTVSNPALAQAHRGFAGRRRNNLLDDGVANVLSVLAEGKLVDEGIRLTPKPLLIAT